MPKGKHGGPRGPHPKRGGAAKIRITVRFTPDEFTTITTAALRTKSTRAGFVRESAILRAETLEKEDET